MPAVSHLDRLRGTLPGGLSVGRSAITTDDLDAGMRLEPLHQRLRVPSRQHLDDAVLLEIDQDGAVAMAFAKRPIVDAEHPWRRLLGNRDPANQAQ